MALPIPPSWKDLGKAAKDLLEKEYEVTGSKLEVKTTTQSKVNFKVSGTRDHSSDAISGDLEAKWSDRKNGVALTQLWSTANVLKNTVELENHIAKGLKLQLETTLVPDKNTKNALITSAYKQPGVHTRQHLDLFKGPAVTADVVVGRDGFLVGTEATYDVKQGQLSKYNIAAAYHAPDYIVTILAKSNLSAYEASYYHKVNNDIETSARALYSTKGPASQVTLEVGTKTYLDNAAFVKAKINNSGILTLGYTQALRPGVKASLGLALDTVKLSDNTPGANAHKVGASMSFEN